MEPRQNFNINPLPPQGFEPTAEERQAFLRKQADRAEKLGMARQAQNLQRAAEDLTPAPMGGQGDGNQGGRKRVSKPYLERLVTKAVIENQVRIEKIFGQMGFDPELGLLFQTLKRRLRGLSRPQVEARLGTEQARTRFVIRSARFLAIDLHRKEKRRRKDEIPMADLGASEEEAESIIERSSNAAGVAGEDERDGTEEIWAAWKETLRRVIGFLPKVVRPQAKLERNLAVHESYYSVGNTVTAERFGLRPCQVTEIKKWVEDKIEKALALLQEDESDQLTQEP